MIFVVNWGEVVFFAGPELLISYQHSLPVGKHNWVNTGLDDRGNSGDSEQWKQPGHGLSGGIRTNIMEMKDSESHSAVKPVYLFLSVTNLLICLPFSPVLSALPNRA